MRLHFISRLALLVGAGFLVVASQVWSGDPLEWLFIAGGVVMVAAAAIDAEALGRAQRTLDGLIGLLGVWSIVQAIVFEGSNLEWFSFATAVVLAGLATLGLIIHESGAKRSVRERVTTPLTH